MQKLVSTLIKLTLLFIVVVSCALKDTTIKSNTNWESINVYIDDAFSDDEVIIIKKSFVTWESVLDNKLKFNIKSKMKRPSLFKDREPFSDGIFIWYLNPRDELDENMAYEDRKYLINYEGIFLGRKHISGDIVMLIRYNLNDRFYGVMLHEIGHFIGLSHVEDRESLMHASTGTNCVTLNDAERACKMYKCEPKPECY